MIAGPAVRPVLPLRPATRRHAGLSKDLGGDAKALDFWSSDDHNTPMSEHSVADAKAHLSALIDRALKGEEVVITRHGRPVATLRAIEPPKPRRMTPSESIAWLRAHRVGARVPAEDAASLVSRMRDEEWER